MRTRVKPGWIIVLLIFLSTLWLFWLGQNNRPEFQAACAGTSIPTFAKPRTLPKTLRGARIVLNPGHGITLTDQETWGFQRPQANGISVFVLEDDSNVRLARKIKKVLEFYVKYFYLYYKKCSLLHNSLMLLVCKCL